MFTLCVCVNNTKKDIKSKNKQKKTKNYNNEVCAEKSIYSDAMVTPTDDFEKNSVTPKPSILVAPPFNLGVSLKELNVVFSTLSLYLSLVWMHRLKSK